MANHYGWWWVVKACAKENRVKDDEVYKWNVVRFFNELQIIRSLNSLKKFENFTNSI